jgi:hypothetical protein
VATRAGLGARTTRTRISCESAPGSPASPWTASWAKRALRRWEHGSGDPAAGTGPGRRAVKGCQILTAQFSHQATRGCQNLTAQFRHQADKRLRAPGRLRAASSWSPSSRRPPVEEGRGSPGDSDDASYSPPITLRTVAGSGTWRAVGGVALGRIGAAWPPCHPICHERAQYFGIMTSAADGAGPGSGPAHSGLAGPTSPPFDPVALQLPGPGTVQQARLKFPNLGRRPQE